MPFSTASLAKMERAHSQFLLLSADVLEKSLEDTGKTGVDYAKKHPRFTPRSGNLQKKNKHKVIKNGRVLVISNSAKYAAAIDKGARPHDITAKNGGLLRFRGRGGAWVSKRRIKHPGNRPFQFLQNATVAAHRFGGRDLRQRLTRLAAQF
jgi:hypothetical protein